MEPATNYKIADLHSILSGLGSHLNHLRASWELLRVRRCQSGHGSRESPTLLRPDFIILQTKPAAAVARLWSQRQSFQVVPSNRERWAQHVCNVGSHGRDLHLVQGLVFWRGTNWWNLQRDANSQLSRKSFQVLTHPVGWVARRWEDSIGVFLKTTLFVIRFLCYTGLAILAIQLFGMRPQQQKNKI